MTTVLILLAATLLITIAVFARALQLGGFFDAEWRLDRPLDQTVFVVGEHVSDTWELTGVYTTRRRAEIAAFTARHFVAPIALDDEPVRERNTEWPGLYFPHRKTHPDILLHDPA